LLPLKRQGGKMSKERFLTGILAIVLVFGMMVIGCSLLEPEQETTKVDNTITRVVIVLKVFIDRKLAVN
jgi:hypothetical protein